MHVHRCHAYMYNILGTARCQNLLETNYCDWRGTIPSIWLPTWIQQPELASSPGRFFLWEKSGLGTHNQTIQGTKKMGCPVHIVVKVSLVSLVSWVPNHGNRVRQLKKNRHKEISRALKGVEHACKIERHYFVSLPSNKAHEKVHPTGIVSGLSQRVHPLISMKNYRCQWCEMHLGFFVKTERKSNLPNESNRAYLINTDIWNHIDAANTTLQLAKFDQISLKSMYEEWMKRNGPGKYLFCPYIKKEPTVNFTCSPSTCPESSPSESPTNEHLSQQPSNSDTSDADQILSSELVSQASSPSADPDCNTSSHRHFCEYIKRSGSRIYWQNMTTQWH